MSRGVVADLKGEAPIQSRGREGTSMGWILDYRLLSARASKAIHCGLEVPNQGHMSTFVVMIFLPSAVVSVVPDFSWRWGF
jgi:hypothetical protein